MKYSILVILLFLVSCGKRPQDDITKSDPYFWKAEKEGKISYWLGTIHQGVALHELPCTVFIQQQLQASNLVWTERGVPTKKEGEIQDADLLSSNSQDFNSLNTETQQFLRQKNIADNLSYIGYIFRLSNLCFQEGLGASTLTFSMDNEVRQVAQMSKIPIKALDDTSVFKDITNAFTKEDVEQQVESYHNCPKRAKNQVNTYKQAKWDKLSYDDKNYTKEVLKKRNQKWMEKFKSSYKSYNQMFLAAGVAHFIGPFSILDMLEEEGFSVQRVSCSKSIGEV